MEKLQIRLREAFENLSSREQRLVLAMAAIFGVLITVLPMFLMWSNNSELQAQNDELQALIARLNLQRTRLQQSAREYEAAMARYKNPTPPLGSYMESLAKAQSISLQEVTEEPAKVVGSYERRLVKVTLPKVGLSEVIRLLDSIARSPHPVAVEELTVNHNRSGDEYDVKVGLVSYDKKKKKKESGKAKAGAAEEG